MAGLVRRDAGWRRTRALCRAVSHPALPLAPPYAAEPLEPRRLLAGVFEVSDAQVIEGDSGTPALLFQVRWLGPAGASFVTITTSDGTASAAEGDYVPQQKVLAFFASDPSTQTIRVPVNPDFRDEVHETVIATLSNPIDAIIADGTGVGLIHEDDDHRPTAQIMPVSPDPRADPVAWANIQFSENIHLGFDLADLTLTRDRDRNNLLTPAQALSTTDSVSWFLSDLTAVTSLNGTYFLSLSSDPASSGIVDGEYNSLAGGALATWTMNGDPDDQIAEAMPAGNGTTSGQVTGGDSVDMYSFAVAAGATGNFSLAAVAGHFEPVLFTRLRLFNASGGELRSDGVGFSHTFTTAGTYYLGVSEGGNAYDPVTGVDPVPIRAGGKYAVTIAIKPPVVAAGAEFRVNTYTPNSQAFASMAMASGGEFVVVWESIGQDTASDGVYGQRYSASGAPLGGEFLVNSTPAGNQSKPQAAMDSAGGFVVVWQGPDASGSGVFARRYNAAGVAQGSQLPVNTTTALAQGEPAVAMDDDGDFVVTWQSTNQAGPATLNDVYARRYSKTGAPAVDGEFLVNTVTTAQQQWSPAVAMDDAGGFVIAWESSNHDPDGSTGIYAQRYAPTGAAQGNEFPVNSITDSDQNEPSISMEADGDFVVAWHGVEPRGGGGGVYARRFTALGLPHGDDIHVNSFIPNAQRDAAVAVDDDGDFVVTWQSYFQDPGGGLSGVYAQRYNASGGPVGDEWRVNFTTANEQQHPAAAIDADGDFVIAWASNGQDPGDGPFEAGVYAQRYSSGDGLVVPAGTTLNVPHVRASSVFIGANATLNVIPHGGTGGASKIGSGGLAVEPGGVFNFNDNDLVIANTAAWDVRALINAGTLMTALTTAPGGKTTGLAWAQGNDPNLAQSLKTSGMLSGQSFGPNDTLAKYTYHGDADLDGDVDGNDIAKWGLNFTGDLGAGVGTKTWTQGDWDRDGDVDGNDAARWGLNFTGDLGGGGLSLGAAATPNTLPTAPTPALSPALPIPATPALAKPAAVRPAPPRPSLKPVSIAAVPPAEEARPRIGQLAYRNAEPTFRPVLNRPRPHDPRNLFSSSPITPLHFRSTPTL